MIREEARDQIVIFMCDEQKVINDRDKQALEMAIQALEQSSGDLISRQAAIDIIERWLSCDDYNEAEQHIMRATESILYDLSSINPQEPKWIPVSEKLPSDCNEDWVLVQIQEDNGYLWIPCVAEYRKDTDDWYSDANDIGWLKNHRGFFKVIAWMPLPQPYKAGREDI